MLRHKINRLLMLGYDNFFIMRKLQIFALLVLILFIGCVAAVPPETSDLSMQAIESAFLKGTWDDVINGSENRLAEEPNNVVLHFILSVAYYMKGEYGLLTKYRSLALEGEGSTNTIVTWCQDFAKRFPNNYYSYLLLGSAYREDDKMVQAIKSYEKALELKPDFTDAYIGIGSVYLESLELETAIYYFKKAIDIDPRHDIAYFDLGVAYGFNGQIDEAIAMCKKAIELNPRFVEAYSNLGDLYLEKGDKDEALKAYEKVIELDPESEIGINAAEEINNIKNPLDTN
jgi:tetratricopeptide (TPR) repeat protein